MKQAQPSPDEYSLLEASNEFLNHEIHGLEIDGDTMRRELREIHQSYARKIINGYRRWIARHRENPVVWSYEQIALRLLNRTVGSSEVEEGKRYPIWLEEHKLTPKRIESINAALATFPYRPLVSVVLTVGSATIEKWLEATITSVRAQLYQNWQLAITCEEGTEPSIEARLAEYAHDDLRIEVRASSGGNAVTLTTIEFGDSVTGEFIVFLDQFGELNADALYEVVKRLNRTPLDDLIYWDEDRLDRDGRRTEPFFKPDWSPNLLLSMNYIGECFVARRTLIEKVGGIRQGFGRSQKYDLALRAVEQTERIVHLSQVLYHRRYDESLSPGAEEHCEHDPNNTRAIDEALQRRGERGRVDTVGPGLYAVRYEIRDEPLVSILIPTRDQCRLLRQCLESIRQSTDYRNYQVIVLDNASAEPETLEYFKQMAGEIKIHRYPGKFNFSAINNSGAANAAGEFLVFLNNDTQVIRRDWMHAMIEQAQRPEVGAVGARLLFGDGRIQHAGVVLGIGGTVGHAFRFKPGEAKNYFGLDQVIRDCSAVTAACMMMRRSVFDQVGGFDERLSVEFNDIDLCLRLQQCGYRVVYTPLALLYHYESSSRRGIDAAGNLQLFVERWAARLKDGDPFYNRNLTLAHEDWSIAV